MMTLGTRRRRRRARASSSASLRIATCRKQVGIEVGIELERPDLRLAHEPVPVEQQASPARELGERLGGKSERSSGATCTQRTRRSTARASRGVHASPIASTLIVRSSPSYVNENAVVVALLEQL